MTPAERPRRDQEPMQLAADSREAFAEPSALGGLAEAEARARLDVEGYNELPRSDRRTPLRIILEVVREPMLALLLGGGVIYLAARRPAGSADPARLRDHVGRDHRGAGDAHRARAGGAARPHQPARARHSRWRAQAHRRPGGGARRSRRAGRGRPGAGRRDAGSKPRPADRRIAADRRIGAGAQGRAGAADRLQDSPAGGR